MGVGGCVYGRGLGVGARMGCECLVRVLLVVGMWMGNMVIKEAFEIMERPMFGMRGR
jgi:hypothetical protein